MIRVRVLDGPGSGREFELDATEPPVVLRVPVDGWGDMPGTDGLTPDDDPTTAWAFAWAGRPESA
jgi:hypothetical protein